MFNYPWGDFHSLNLGWFLLQFKDWVEKIQEYLDNGGGTSENLANVIAPVFNASNYYLTGDYVLYNNELYKANQAVNPGTWNPDAWTMCLITEEMGSGAGGVDNVARLMIAGQYSNTYNYRKYAICRYSDKLWMCNTNLPAGGEEWEPSHWDEITVGAGLTGLRISVETLNNNILNLQSITKRNFILLGDSFSIGYTTDDGNTYRQTSGGWANYAKTMLQALGHIVYNTNDITAQVAGNTGFASSLPFLTLLQDIAAIIDNKDVITDIIVMGGTNDVGHESGIKTAIESFVTYAKNTFPNAKISVGCLGSNLGTLYNSVAPLYRHISDLGGIYIDDLAFLFCDPQYYCADGVHLTESGYNFYIPYLMEAILKKGTNYSFMVPYTLALVNSAFTEYGSTPTLILQYKPHSITYFIQGEYSYALSFGNLSVQNNDIFSITPELRLPSYYAKMAQTIVFGISNSNTVSHLKGCAYPFLKSNRFCMGIKTNNPDLSNVQYFYMYPNQTAYTQEF